MSDITRHSKAHEPAVEKDAQKRAEIESRNALCQFDWAMRIVYVNENWNIKSAIHLSAYVMWRLNWIHPFDDGNGRTSRIVSYLVLCLRAKMKLPGSNTIPEQISENKSPYYDALENADKKWLSGVLDLSAMEKLIDSMLAAQLCSIHSIARAENEGVAREMKLH